MNIRALVATTILLVAGAAAAAAQNMPPVQQIKLQPIQATVNTNLEVNTPERKMAKLEAENQRLREENERLRAQHEAMTQLGGSQVKAYCPSIEISRNTAGAENNCASKGYNCESVSGLCHTSCSNADACAVNFNCDPATRQCISGVPVYEED